MVYTVIVTKYMHKNKTKRKSLSIKRLTQLAIMYSKKRNPVELEEVYKFLEYVSLNKDY